VGSHGVGVGSKSNLAAGNRKASLPGEISLAQVSLVLVLFGFRPALGLFPFFSFFSLSRQLQNNLNSIQSFDILNGFEKNCIHSIA
jgi:hypothetical protein